MFSNYTEIDTTTEIQTRYSIPLNFSGMIIYN